MRTLKQLTVASNTMTEFDSRGDFENTVWSEEQAEQRSPFDGEAGVMES